MSDEYPPKKPNAVYEPGTLEQTRKNIGAINKEEAERMTKILGGKIFTEKQKPIDPSIFPGQSVKKHSHTGTFSGSRSKPGTHRKSTEQNPDLGKNADKSLNSNTSLPSKAKKKTENGLPEITPRDWQLMDQLMMSQDYRIKPNYGFFNFVRYLQKNGVYKVSPEFAEIDMKRAIEHLEAFITIIKTFIQTAPVSYKNKIQKDNNLKFRFLRKVAGWSVRELKVLYIDIEKNADSLTIADLIPYIREMYSILIQVLYIGETRISLLIKEMYTDQTEYPGIDKKKVSTLAKSAIREWDYIYTQIINGMYPILMRACGGSYDLFPAFFTSNTKKILAFLGKTKFDVLTIEPQIQQDQQDRQNYSASSKQEENTADAGKQKESTPQRNSELVEAGISLLDTLFPQAGFTSLEKMPDLYPYFQPLFEFEDGFNLLAPENPMQVIVVLLRILEDLFHGCRNIEFNFESGENKTNTDDTISAVLTDWSAYREMLFNKEYATTLTDFVNELYTQSDFTYSQYGKKLINKLQWLTQYHFLPLFKFEKLLLERPEHTTTYRPLYFRTGFICKSFTEIAKSIDKAAKNKTIVAGVQNPWEHYHFDISNTVSERLDVLLVAKRTGPHMTATNANLIKYTLCIMSVLDWWLNDPASPAYLANPMKIYRVSDQDKGPVFSVPVREDLKQLFIENVQTLIKKRAAKKTGNS